MLLTILLLSPLGIFWIVVGQVAIAALGLVAVTGILRVCDCISFRMIFDGACLSLLGCLVMVLMVLAVPMVMPSLAGLTLLATQVLCGGVAYVATVLLLLPLDELELMSYWSAAKRK